MNICAEEFTGNIETEQRIGFFKMQNLVAIICLFLAHNATDENV
jgi:hypothetical protein